MGWSQIVHENRKETVLSRARFELRQQKRGYDIELTPDASLPALFTLLGALSGAVWWRREGRKVHGRDLRNLPGMQLLFQLLGGTQQSATSQRGKAKPKQSTKQAVRNKAAAAAAAVAAAQSSTAKAASSSSSSGTAGGWSQPAAAPPAASKTEHWLASSGQQQQLQAKKSSNSSSKSKKKRGKKNK